MVEENFEFWLSEMHQNERFYVVFSRTYSSWLKKILNLDDLKCTRMKNVLLSLAEHLHHGWRKFWIFIIWNEPEWKILCCFLAEHIHNGWRKFWILMIWNAPGWRIFCCLSQNIFTMVEENFEYWLSEMNQNEGF